MARFFNTTGPCNPDDHYMLPPEKRVIRAQLDRYIQSKLYWVLHAPRQTGKTTFLISWMKAINAGEEAVACYVSVERCQEFPQAEDSMPAICEAIRQYGDVFLGKALTPDIPDASPASILATMLSDWSALVAPKPLVVLFDEVDVLQDQALVSFLRQLRGGFPTRGVGSFPVSVALVGMRDLRDYLVQSKDGVPLNPGSPFNIKQDSATLSLFTAEDIQDLVAQHVTETGQPFAAEAVEAIWDATRGQPWLVNALLQKCTWALCPNGEPVTIDHIREAREILIQDRAVHLDSLAERLRDPRIKKIVELIFTGDMEPELLRGDDYALAQDLGLVTAAGGSPEIANPIYREIIARVLSMPYQLSMPQPEWRWKKPDGTLDMDALFREFQDFWSQHGDIWEEKADYTEAFPHLLVMAFLQRVTNGGGPDAWPSDDRKAVSRPGRIEREFAAGRGRVDLAVLYGGAWTVIEIKLVSRRGREATVEQGLTQISRYRDTVDPKAAAYLVVFDRTEAGRAKTWEERLTWETRDAPGGAVTVVGG